MLHALVLLTFTTIGAIMPVNPPEQDKTVANYGEWPSPVTPQMAAQSAPVILNMAVDGDDTYWCELRPENKGRYTIVKRDALGKVIDITPPEFNARTLVHEYGGGAFAVADGIVYASNSDDGAIYQIAPGKPPAKLTAGTTKEGGVRGTRFADLCVTKNGVIAVGETHAPGKTAENFLALIDSATGSYKKIAAGHDFYSSPAVRADGSKLAWISWDFPEMPWTNTQLWIADINSDGTLAHSKQVAGDLPEALFQPQWSPEGILYFVTDRDKGWWNIHRFADGKITNVCPLEAESAEPLWVFGRSNYAFLGSNIIFSYNKEGFWHLALLETKTGKTTPIERPAVSMKQLRSGKGCVRYLEGYLDKDEAIVQLDNDPKHTVTVLRSSKAALTEADISKPEHIAFKSGDATAYGLFYPPVNARFKGPEGKLPPLIVMIHGGPTSQAKIIFQMKMQYWTSRGFAVLDVNYRGSTGYGRRYRSLLDKQWGIADVEDCINGVQWLIAAGRVDPAKIAIRGGSAGGFTTLATLAASSLFTAGANYFGVADITALANDTHKFESKYMDLLVGKYPDEKHLWIERSPIHHVAKIKAPLAIFQGEDDTVVPKNQSVMIYDALKEREVPVEFHLYPGEEHGFRKAENVIDSLEKERLFYLKVFGNK